MGLASLCQCYKVHGTFEKILHWKFKTHLWSLQTWNECCCRGGGGIPPCPIGKIYQWHAQPLIGKMKYVISDENQLSQWFTWILLITRQDPPITVKFQCFFKRNPKIFGTFGVPKVLQSPSFQQPTTFLWALGCFHPGQVACPHPSPVR